MNKGKKTDFTKENKQILFLHGYLSNGKSFNRQIPYFSREFEVFCPDMKGFGENLGMEKPYSLDDYILDMQEYMYKNGIKKPHVIAHSFGGRLVIKSAATNPELFNKIVLTGAAGLKPKNTLKKRVSHLAFNLLKKFIPKEKLTSFYSKDYLSLDGVMKESFKLIISETLDDKLDYITNPTLIINGAQDKETPPYMAKKLNAGIKNSKLIFLEGAGHFAFIDKSIKFNTEVREFLLS